VEKNHWSFSLPGSIPWVPIFLIKSRSLNEEGENYQITLQGTPIYIGKMVQIALKVDDFILSSPFVRKVGLIGGESHQINFREALLQKVHAQLQLTSPILKAEGKVAMALVPAVQGLTTLSSRQGFYGSFTNIISLPGVAVSSLSHSMDMHAEYVPDASDGEVYQWWLLGDSRSYEFSANRSVMYMLYIAYEDITATSPPKQIVGSDVVTLELRLTSEVKFRTPLVNSISLRSKPQLIYGLDQSHPGVVDSRGLGISGIPFGWFRVFVDQDRWYITISKSRCGKVIQKP
jgi:hypothetical protein